MGVMGETIAAMFRALVLTLCVLSAAASTSFEDQVSPDTIIPQDEEVFSFVEIEQETMMGSGAGVEDVCVDQTNSDGTDWHDADGEYYDCAWYGSYESYCEWYGDHYASEMDGVTASQACCTCGGGSTADVVLLEAKATAKGPIMVKPPMQ